jgi:hypothetical protein
MGITTLDGGSACPVPAQTETGSIRFHGYDRTIVLRVIHAAVQHLPGVLHCMFGPERGSDSNNVLSIISRYDILLQRPYGDAGLDFLPANGSDIASIEFIADRKGEFYTYDVNTNTN